MRITLLSVGRRAPAWIEQGFAEYARRLPVEWALETLFVPAPPRDRGWERARCQAVECTRLLAAVPKNARAIALDEHGTAWSSAELAREVSAWQRDGRDVALLVGGADGLAEPCLRQVERCWSLSPLTLPHALVRVIVAEQLYRAWSILHGHPYHRA